MNDPEQRLPETFSYAGRLIGCLIVCSITVLAVTMLALSVKALHWVLFS